MMASTITLNIISSIHRCHRGYLKNKAQCEHAEKIEQRAIELGHCFILGDHYTKLFHTVDDSADISVEKK